MFRVTFRSAAEKADPEAWWKKPDDVFFANGACHVLAGVFLETYRGLGFRAVMIQPGAGFRGAHVVVSDGERIFDCRGWNEHEGFLRGYTAALREHFPGFSHVLAPVDDPIGWVFCREHGHRHPSQFPGDVIARARRYLERFDQP